MTHDLLFEIGAEELPAAAIPPALAQLERGVREGLESLRIAHGGLRTFGTPRRLAVQVSGVAVRQSDLDEEAMGPAVRVAFDDRGGPTRALTGFCAGRGVDVSAVRRIATPKGEYVAVTVHHAGRPAADVVPKMLAAVAARLTFPQVMRWMNDDTRFARPVRWLVALLGPDVLDVEAFGLRAGRESRGHRFLAPGVVKLRNASDYEAKLEQAFVIADPARRAARILKQVAARAAEIAGTARADDELLEINNFLVEWPTAVRGSFDEKYRALPGEVTLTALREHQRFFAVGRSGTGESALMPNFIAVRNGDDRGTDIIRKGFEDVLVARLEDALFYWTTDLKKPPAEQVEALSHVVWMEGLGSLREKAQRLEALGEWVARRLAPETVKAVRRAALLCKTDLLSEMIGSGKEYADLQGVIGAYYAAAAGESREACDAIRWHYHPRSASDQLPGSDAGAMLSLADKLDHVAGAFVAGKVPSGSEDPYGVRRAANGVVRILIEQRRNLDLRDASMESTRLLFAANLDLARAEIMKRLGDFWHGRVEAALDERGVAYDSRDAAIGARVILDAAPRPRPGWIDPCDALARARALGNFRSDGRFEPLVVLFKRVSNILTKNTEPLSAPLDRARLSESVESALADALDQARAASEPLWQARDYERIIPALLEMEHPIHAFFDGVMVNAENRDLRLNRLRLLSEVRELFLRGWDLSRVVVEGEKT
ncbi:MAG: glycine--tRNA ligase subunit beta [Candidatus Eisenbacteria bacterium]|nr:glycine--tRNA ligase subunit beta [Candidatus Eisenbacteria bacterium]